jgi:hypothetical protein
MTTRFLVLESGRQAIGLPGTLPASSRWRSRWACGLGPGCGPVEQALSVAAKQSRDMVRIAILMLAHAAISRDEPGRLVP